MNTPLADNSDEFNAFKKGAARALDPYYKRLHQVVYWYIFRMCQDDYVARHVTIEAFHTVWEKRDHILNERHLVAYLYITAKCRYLSGKRADKVWERVQKEALTSVEDAYDFLDDREVVRTNALAALHSAMGELPSQQYKVIHKLYFERKTVRMVAAELGLIEQTVRNHHNKAREFLRVRLAGLQFAFLLTGLFLLLYGG